MALDHSCQVQRHTNAERGLDLYETPAPATETLLRIEQIPLNVWEPAAGRGAITRVLQAHGRNVISSDIHQYDFNLDFVGDFLAQKQTPPGCGAILTNPPFQWVEQFVAHALELSPLVFMLLRLDPGIHGGCAIVSLNDGAAPQLIDAIDIPVAGVGAKERVDVLALRAWIQTHKPDHAIIERAQAMPKQGASSGFKYGRATGSLEAVIACCEVPLTIIEPTTWKKFHHLHGGDKESGRQLALQKFPSAHTLFIRKKDHGRAEAALIALAGGNHA